MVEPVSNERIDLEVCLEVPVFFTDPAKYALKSLLQPLGLRPVWISKNQLTKKGLYYGMEIMSSAGVHIHFSRKTAVFFKSDDPFPGDPQWQTESDIRWPLVFDSDPIASAFYWLSGWQEKYTIQRDQHGRFQYQDSLQCHLNIGDIPVVDFGRNWLAEKLSSAGIKVKKQTWNGKDWAFCATHDIDQYQKWRPGIIYRELVQYFMLNHKKQAFGKRLGRLFRSIGELCYKADPFTAGFSRLLAESDSRGQRSTVFLKAGAHGQYDTKYDLKKLTTEILQYKAKGFTFGLHPSYFAHEHFDYLQTEADCVTAHKLKRPTVIRQHYLRYRQPLTSALQELAGFKIDSTLGFADYAGFRRGTCFPFQIFDLDAHRVINIWEMPLIIMEGSLFTYEKLSYDEAISRTKNLMAMCQKVGGVCIMLWHEIIFESFDFEGWDDHFLASLDLATDRDAFVDTLPNVFSAGGFTFDE